MFAAILNEISDFLERKVLRSGLLEHPKDPFIIYLVLFHPIDHDRVMVSRTPEQVTRGEVGGIAITACIDHDGLSPTVILEAQQLIMFVVAKTLCPNCTICHS